MLKFFFDRLPHDTRRFLYSHFCRGSYRAMQERRRAVADSGPGYSAFDEFRCIFVRIPGTDGTAVSQALFGNRAGGHDSIERYQLVFSKAEFDVYFKFCFVRNPWDRTFYAYNYLMSDAAGEEDKRWAKHHLTMYRDFADFVERGLTLATVLEEDYFIPQYKFITPSASDKPSMDFIGRHENLEADFDSVRKKLGKPESAQLDRSDPARDVSVGNYRDAYTALAKEIVARAYALDIEMFGYKFE